MTTPQNELKSKLALFEKFRDDVLIHQIRFLNMAVPSLVDNFRSVALVCFDKLADLTQIIYEEVYYGNYEESGVVALRTRNILDYIHQEYESAQLNFLQQNSIVGPLNKLE